MSGVVLSCRLLLAGVLLVAGAAKLADLVGSRRAARDFGLPARVAMVVGSLLPFVELAAAIALLLSASALWGAAGALVLLVAFSLAIAGSLARGQEVDCHCFGQLHSSAVRWPALARNVALAAVAGFVLIVGLGDPGPSAMGVLTGLSRVGLVALVGGVIVVLVAALSGWFGLHMLRQHGRLLLRIDTLEETLTRHGIALPDGGAQTVASGLAVGTAAPHFALWSVEGKQVTSDFLLGLSRRLLLVFSDPGCGPCNALLPEIARWQQSPSSVLTVAVVSTGDPDANRAKAAEHGIDHVLLQGEGEVSDAYAVAGRPAAVLIGGGGLIASPLALGAEQIRALVAQAEAPALAEVIPVAGSANGNRAAASQPGHLAIGERTPGLVLPGLDGEPVRIAGHRDRQTVLLFWNPGCGFCQRMLRALKVWERQRPEDAPDLLVVSTGAVAVNRAMGLNSMVVVDQEFETGRLFGASGTPMAVLIDADGNVASGLAAGAEPVLSLLGAPAGHKAVLADV